MEKNIEKTLFAEVEKTSFPTAKELAENTMNPKIFNLEKEDNNPEEQEN